MNIKRYESERESNACCFHVNRVKKINSSELLTIGYLTSGDTGIKKHKGIKLCDWKNDYRERC